MVHAYLDPNYVEDALDPFGTGLEQITSINDGVMDDVHLKRKKYGADLVALMIHDDNYCGAAWRGPDPAKMFSVVRHSCATGYFSFGHEL